MADVQGVCSCPRNALCDGCVKKSLAWLTGAAMLRGERWAESVARRRPDLRARPWPAYEGRCAEIARGRVHDLGRDPRLLDLLGSHVHAQAAAWWSGELERRRDAHRPKHNAGSGLYDG